MSLTFSQKILVGLTLGILTGVFLGERALVLEVGSRWVRQAAADDRALLDVMVSIIESLGSLSLADARRLVFRAGGTWNPEPGQDRASMLGGDGAAGSPNTGWPRYNRVAAQPAQWVGPNQVAWFQFTIVAPLTPGTYRLAIRPLVEGAQWMEDFGVFWIVTVKDPRAS